MQCVYFSNAGPEFCLVFRKLNSSCHTNKRLTLTEQYPQLCELISGSFSDICDANPLDESLGHIERQGFLAATASASSSDSSEAAAAEANKPRAFTQLFSESSEQPPKSKKKALKLMYLIHKYSRENLLLANIYIKVIIFTSF